VVMGDLGSGGLSKTVFAIILTRNYGISEEREMKNTKIGIVAIVVLVVFAGALVLTGEGKMSNAQAELKALLPQITAWSQTEEAQNYYPENLFEYINGAAEIYLAYDFQELIVSQHEKDQSEMNVAVEIYNMGNGKNAFGIYSAERFSDNNFIDVGLQGYLEEGTLNFLVGQYYVKLLCFDCEAQSADVLKLFSQEIVNKVGGTGSFPLLVQKFPKEGLIPNTEKYILRNFMGYSFLRNGYSANYKKGDLEFDCFFIESKSQEDAQAMVDKYLEAKGKDNVTKYDLGYHIKDRYYHNIYLARVGSTICGVIKIKEGFETIGKKYIEILIESLKK
jgi:hypothetical protein